MRRKDYCLLRVGRVVRVLEHIIQYAVLNWDIFKRCSENLLA
jgi:hypothetical protein